MTISTPGNRYDVNQLAAPGRHVFDGGTAQRPIPTVVFTPEGKLQGVILACHGGTGHKEANSIQAITSHFHKLGYVVVAIDGPVHGARRSDGSLDPTVAITAFRQAWKEGVGRTEMADDFVHTLDTIMQVPAFSTLPVGYIGVSMGTAYGIPFLAKERRIRAAVIGLWASTYAASEHLLDYAPDICCPVWFTQQWHDQAFDHAGTHALFDAIGSEDKRLVAYPGPHLELQGERLGDAVEFLDRKMQQQVHAD